MDSQEKFRHAINEAKEYREKYAPWEKFGQQYKDFSPDTLQAALQELFERRAWEEQNADSIRRVNQYRAEQAALQTPADPLQALEERLTKKFGEAFTARDQAVSAEIGMIASDRIKYILESNPDYEWLRGNEAAQKRIRDDCADAFEKAPSTQEAVAAVMRVVDGYTQIRKSALDEAFAKSKENENMALMGRGATPPMPDALKAIMPGKDASMADIDAAWGRIAALKEDERRASMR